MGRHGAREALCLLDPLLPAPVAEGTGKTTFFVVIVVVFKEKNPCFFLLFLYFAPSRRPEAPSPAQAVLTAGRREVRVGISASENRRDGSVLAFHACPRLCEALRVQILPTSVCSQEFIVVFKLNCWKKNKRGEVCLGAGVTTAGYDARSVVKTVCP